MADIANFMEEGVLNHYLRGQATNAPSQTYLAIFNSSASAGELETGTLTNEITSYTGNRPRLDNVLDAATQVGGKATVTTNADIDYEDMPAVTVEYAAVMDAATAGNVLCYAALTTPVAVSAGATFRIPSGDFTFDLD